MGLLAPTVVTSFLRHRFDTAARAYPELRRVVHADPGAGNVFAANVFAATVLADNGRVMGVIDRGNIDWGSTVAGDPLYHIAHLTF